MSGPVSAQWSLSTTGNDLIAAGRGLFEAATSDDVQPIALLACEALGATLAISTETSAKVHQLCSQTGHTVLRFMKAQVGWRKGDSGWYLAQSDAGLRFLGLAACLVTMDHWMAAQVLKNIITDTAADKKLVPTTHQLQQLLRALDARLARAGFVNEVIGCEALLPDGPPDKDNPNYMPTQETIGALATTCATLGRIGQSDRIARLYVSNTKEVGWILAFIKWTLGQLPTMVAYGQVFLKGYPQFEILLGEVNKDTYHHNKLIILNRVNQLADLVKELPSAFLETSPANGLISIRSYGQLLLRDFDFDHQESTKIYRSQKIIPIACRIAYDRMKFPTALIAADLGTDTNYTTSTASLWNLRRIEEVMQDLLGNCDAKIPRSTAPLTRNDLNEVIRSSCVCGYCRTATLPSGMCPYQDKSWRLISSCVSDIFALSIIESLDPNYNILVASSHESYGDASELSDMFNASLKESKTQSINASLVFERALVLLGHGLAHEVGLDRLMSSRRGQCVWLKTLETFTLTSDDMMRVVCLSGELNWDDERYDEATSQSELSPTQRVGLITPMLKILDTGKISPLDNFKRLKIEWRVWPVQRQLQLSLLVQGEPKYDLLPPRLLCTMRQEPVFVNCSHFRKAPFNLDDLAFPPRILPIGPDNVALLPPRYKPVTPKHDFVRVAHTDRNDAMRILALALNRTAVVREDACLACCYDACIRLDLDLIIC